MPPTHIYVVVEGDVGVDAERDVDYCFGEFFD